MLALLPDIASANFGVMRGLMGLQASRGMTRGMGSGFARSGSRFSAAPKATAKPTVNPALQQRVKAFKTWKANTGKTGPVTRQQFASFRGAHTGKARGVKLYEPKSRFGFGKWSRGVGTKRSGSWSGRPSWRNSELTVERRLAAKGPKANFTQRSYLNGKVVPHGTKGSTRPDVFRTNGRRSYAYEVKNYDLRSSAGRSRAVGTLRNQMTHRSKHLPPNTRQQVVFDIRGQGLSRSQQSAFRNQLANGSGGMLRRGQITFLNR